MSGSKQSQLEGLHHLIRGVILSGFAFYIAFLSKSGMLSLYIAPKMIVYVKLSAIGLFAVGLHQLYSALSVFFGTRKEAYDCDCAHEMPKSSWGSAAFYGIFLFPLLFGVLTPDKVMGSSMVDKKGIQLSAAQSQGAAPGAAAGAAKKTSSSGASESLGAPKTGNAEKSSGTADRFKTDQFNEDFAVLARWMDKKDTVVVQDDIFMEILTTLDLFKNEFQGKTIEISGFVYRPDDLTNEQLVISRFAMSCCSADAAPYGVMVTYPRANQYEKDAWLKITGTIGKTVYNGNEIMQIKASKIEKLQPLANPYVYPNYDFLAVIK